MKAILNSPDKQQAFEEDGFVLLDDFISHEEVEYFSEFVKRVFKTPITDYSKGVKASKLEKTSYMDDDMQITQTLLNLDIQKSIIKEIAALGKKNIRTFLNKSYISPFCDALFKKNTGRGGGAGEPHFHFAHRNPSLSDYPSFTLFVPLCDIEDSTGPISFVKGSYKLWTNCVHPITCTQIENTNPNLVPLIKQYLHRMYPKAGQAILFNSHTIHAGHPVAEGKERSSLTIDMVPDDQEILWYFTEYQSGRIASVYGKQVFDLPLYFNPSVSWDPLNRTGKERHRIDPFEMETITEEEFKDVCWE